MSVETLTYVALGARLKISREAARSLAKRLRLPRSLSDDGKALVSVDLVGIRHTPRPPGGRQECNIALLAAKRRQHGLKVRWRLCRPVAELAARSTATDELQAGWDI
jgi:hypothetical protein